MKISEQWLRTWVNPAVDSDALAHQLTMAGLEVDDTSPIATPFTGVVVGEVLTVEQHPDADRLRVTTVNIGQAEPLQIVCGAPNVVVGARVPVATVGAVLPNDFKIKKGKLRGVESNGMLCGASEIDLEDSVDGLLILPNDAPIGCDIRDYLTLDDRVIELGITPNRGDCLSVRGLARELGVINGLAVNTPAIAAVEVSIADQVNVNVQSDGCPRYAGRVIRGIDPTAQTPDWMVQALTRSGIRVHSLLVDITNYVLLELGQPMHAFDLATLQGNLDVRVSQGETITLLNDQAVTLDADTLLICDANGPVAIAGVMGGLSSSVTDNSRDIFLESAFFDPLAIAGRARRYGLHTDASQRFERGVDFALPVPALERATGLILALAGGAAGPITLTERLDALPKRAPIALTLVQTQLLLGFAVSADFVVDTLSRLGCQVTGDANLWQVTPPSYRFDMSIAEDCIEEVARIHGYDNIPFALPTLDLALVPQADRFNLHGLRQTLVTLGYQEAISVSFSDAKLETLLNPAVQPLMLANPISSDLAAMRTTLLSSLIPSVQYNVNRQQARVRLFETGLRFIPAANGAVSELQQIATLAMISTGSHWPEQWHAKEKPMDFYDLRAEIDVILAAGRVNATLVRSTRPWLHPGQSADVMVAGQCIGYLGRLHPALAQQLDLPQTFVAELDIDAIMLPYVSNFTQLSRFPSVRRDIAILINANIDTNQIKATVAQAAGDLLVQQWLFDVYAGQGIAQGYRSLAFGLLWQHPDRTLEDAEIKDGMQRIIDALAQNYDATLRAS